MKRRAAFSFRAALQTLFLYLRQLFALFQALVSELKI
jgi:hypothetical protein